jgi:hypothetical protein
MNAIVTSGHCDFNQSHEDKDPNSMELELDLAPWPLDLITTYKSPMTPMVVVTK